MRRFARLALALAIIAALAFALMRPMPARAAPLEGVYTPADVHAAIEIAAEKYGVAWWLLDEIVDCETGGTYDPYSVGDGGTSFGPVQINLRGLWTHYKRVTGGASTYNPYAAIGYLASVEAGYYPGLRASDHWSCHPYF